MVKLNKYFVVIDLEYKFEGTTLLIYSQPGEGLNSRIPAVSLYIK